VIHILQLKEGRPFEIRNPSRHDQNTYQCQEGPMFPFQLFYLQSFLGKIANGPGMNRNRGTAGLRL
jgi:hypothetical protein